MHSASCAVRGGIFTRSDRPPPRCGCRVRFDAFEAANDTELHCATITALSCLHCFTCIATPLLLPAREVPCWWLTRQHSTAAPIAPFIISFFTLICWFRSPSPSPLDLLLPSSCSSPKEPRTPSIPPLNFPLQTLPLPYTLRVDFAATLCDLRRCYHHSIFSIHLFLFFFVSSGASIVSWTLFLSVSQEV